MSVLIDPEFSASPDVVAALDQISRSNAVGDLTVAQVRQIASSLSASSPLGTTGAILYSGGGLAVVESRGLNVGSSISYSSSSLALKVLEQSNSLAIVDNTSVGQFLRSNVFEGVLDDFVARGLISSAEEFTRGAGGLWDDAGRRFAQGVTGDVIFVGPSK